MTVWLLQKPIDDRDTRAGYLRRIDHAGRVECTQLPILARRFFTADAARAFADQHGERFAEWRVVKQP